MKRLIKKANSREDGLTLIESLIALAIIGIIAVGLFSALGTSFIATGVADERSTAKNLSESQMEYVKQLTWNQEGIYDLSDDISSGYPGYSATLDSSTAPDGDNNLQKITITVYHHGEEVLQLEGYKLRSTE